MHRLDWGNRPHPFKEYVDLEPLPLPRELARLLSLGAGVVRTRTYPEGEVFVGVDGEREAALTLLSLGNARPASRGPAVERSADEATPLSRSKLRYPEAHELHRASELVSADEIRHRIDARDDGRVTHSREALGEAIRRRVPSASSQSAPVPAETLARILSAALAPTRLDVPPCAAVYGFAHAVDGVDQSTFRFEPPTASGRSAAESCAKRRPTWCSSSRSAASRRRPSSSWPTSSASRAPREPRLPCGPPRGGIRTGRIYLGASVLGLGATATTFYDDDASRFLAPTLSPLLAAAVGRPRK